MKEITYIRDEDFIKMTKKQKLDMPEVGLFNNIEIDALVLIPSREKIDGYHKGHFFAKTPNKGWWRPMTYDCWRFTVDISDPAKFRHIVLKGDFENNGLNVFSFGDDRHKASISYGGEIKITERNSLQ